MNTRSPTAVLVTGMHRSGTSAIAGALRLLGISLGSRLLAPGDDNPKGYFEHEGVVGINESLMAALGRRWDDVRALPEDWLRLPESGSAASEISALVAEDFAGADVWALKDPRLCRMLPLWRNTLEQLGYRVVLLFVARRPSEVAASIQSRNGWDAPLGELLWLRHVLEAEAVSRGLPRTAIIYDDLLVDPVDRISAALRALDVPIAPVRPEAIDAVGQFVDAGDRHHVHAPEPASEAVATPFSAIAARTYEALHRVAQGEDAWDDVQSAGEDFDNEWGHCGSYIDAVAQMAQRFNLQEQVTQQSLLDARSELRAQVKWAEQAVEVHEAVAAEREKLGNVNAVLSRDLEKVSRERDCLAHSNGLLAEQASTSQREAVVADARRAEAMAQRDALQMALATTQREFKMMHATRLRDLEEVSHERDCLAHSNGLLAEQVSTSQREAVVADARRAEAMAQRDALQMALATTQHELKMMHASWSWKLTSPLRTVSRALRPRP